jgi:hypothetical protein
MAKRPTFIGRHVTAGCFVCSGAKDRWTGPNAQALAARHHDATKHQTWCDVAMSIRYGETAADPRQADIEDAIASARSGGAPECAALTEFDASAVPAADVSAPVGRSSNHALSAAKPEIHAP